MTDLIPQKYCDGCIMNSPRMCVAHQREADDE